MLWCYQRGLTALDYAVGYKKVSAYLRLDVTPQQVLSPPSLPVPITHYPLPSFQNIISWKYAFMSIHANFVIAEARRGCPGGDFAVFHEFSCR